APEAPSQGDDAAGAGGVHTDIIGGHAASEQYPWIVSLQMDWKGDGNWHTCTGTLVFRDRVELNAHCITEEGTRTVPDRGWHVRVGSNNRLDGGETATVVRLVFHEQWNWAEGAPKKKVADLAELTLDHKLNLQPIEIAERPAQVRQKVRLLGWGVDTPDGSGPLPLNLQELDTWLDPPSACADAFI
ncbi:trypsin-like serine protease, partial [Kibdelosporangium lantanae]